MVQTRHRGPPPEKLVKRRGFWTSRWEEIHARLRQWDWATSSAKEVLREALLPLTHGKCAFCESTLGVTDSPQVEHYVAKTVAPSLAFEWTNLLPACGKCNGAKLDVDHAGRLLKPDVEDPEPYFRIHPDTGRLDPHPALDPTRWGRALETIRLLDLQRGPLCAKRAARLVHVKRWLLRLSEDGLTAEIQSEWEELIDPATEYKLVIRRTLELGGQTPLAQEDRRRFEEVETTGRVR